MESNNFSKAADIQGYIPVSIMHRFCKDGNTFFINSAIDHHTVSNFTFVNNNFKRSFGIVRGRCFHECTYEGMVLRKSIFLDKVFVCRALNNISPGCLVKKGYEIKLSRNESYVSIRGQKVLTIQFLESFWMADVNPSQPEGFVKDFTSASTRNIMHLIEKDHAEALRKAEIKKRFGESLWLYDSGPTKYRMFGNERQANLRGDNVAWVLSSSCSVHTINKKEHLANLRSWTDSLGRVRWAGDYKLGNFLLKDVNYCHLDLSNFLSLNRLAEEGFEIYLTNEKATISKNDEICLTVPMVGKYWIANSLHEQNGWLENGCPHENRNMLSFEQKYGEKFTRDEIKKAFDELTHECELEGPTMRVANVVHKM